MDQELAYNILDILQTMQDAVKQMREHYIAGEMQQFNSLSMDLWEGLTAIREVAVQNVPEGSRIRLKDACDCALESLKDIRLFAVTAPEKVEWKLEYELMAIVETMTIQFYYWAVVKEDQSKECEFLDFLRQTESFALLQIPEDKRKYSVDLSIQVTGYNHLDYTKQCVDSILKNLPSDITTEIVVLNHGSSDGTKDYFEKMPQVRVINIAVNGAMPCITSKVVSRGEYSLAISNDITIGKNAISNLYRCMIEHENYGYVVPTTPAISNYQTIFADYDSFTKFEAFAAENNVYDEKRHEQRVRLCNPLQIMPTGLMLQLNYDMYIDKCCGINFLSFPDDKNSLWMRRHGYKCILAKDAYCHHFGAVTLKHDLGKSEEQKQFYLDGRKDFQDKYGVDPWGTGFCYNYSLFQTWEIPPIDGANILGINCGLGSNSLKVKEVMREKGAQKVALYNVTQEDRFLEDLKGVSDYAFTFSCLSEIGEMTGRREFDYIVVDDPIAGVPCQKIAQAIENAGITCKEIAYNNITDDKWQIYKYQRR